MKTAVIIPVFNEKSSFNEIIRQAKKYVDVVIVVDDGSSDAKRPQVDTSTGGIQVLRHQINLGKGAALKTGCEAALQLHADIMVVMDSDGQHKPEDIRRFLQVLHDPHVDIVFGSRKIGRDMPLVMMIGNKFLSLAASILFGIYISDTQSGFRAFTASAYEKIKWNSTRYSVETEMIANVAKKKLAFREIDIETIYKDDYKGTTVLDGVKIFINMLIWKII
ncbi:MAG: glycosyltransferase family 2 protein [Patescibacteria group bacterium]